MCFQKFKQVVQQINPNNLATVSCGQKTYMELHIQENLAYNVNTQKLIKKFFSNSEV